MEIIAPLLSLSVVALLAISTLGGKPGTYQYNLLEGDFFDAEYITYVCPACIAAGIEEECKHNLDKIPHWSDSEQLQIIMQAMGTDSAKAKREGLGVVKFDSKFVFDHDKVKSMFSRATVSLGDEYVDYVYISIDPVGGTDKPENNKSDFVIMTICEPKITVLGIEQLNIVATEGYKHVLINHVRRIRLNQYTRNARIVVDAETGSGFIAPDAAKIIQDADTMNNVVIMTDFEERKIGTITSNESKDKMYQLTRAEMNLGNIRFWNQMITHHPNPKQMMEEFREQMLNYARYAIKAKTPNQVTRYRYSGKGENMNLKDDLCLTLQRAIYSKHRFKTDRKFVQFHV